MKTLRSFRLFLGLVSLVTGLFAADATLPLYPGLSGYTRKVTTNSAEAQRYFNQGLAFDYGFDHEMAIKSFQEAARLDPQCAMAWWGIANACAPNINLPMVDADHAKLAWDAITKAQAVAAHGTPVEQALIQAQALRFAEKYSPDRRALDEAYADAMRKAWHAHPDDPDVGALFAEAMLDLRPWDQWQPDGTAQPGTEEAVAALKTVLQRSADHPMGLHLTIHANEASATPEVALAAADRLRAQRSLIGHMEHMPSHLDVRVGHWREAVESNERAIQSDLRYRKEVGEPQGDLFGYMAHNRHMQAYAAMMTGQSAIALHTIRAMVTELPPGNAVPDEVFPFVDGFAAMPYEVLIRYGRWNEILAEPMPAEKICFQPRAVARRPRHCAGGQGPAGRRAGGAEGFCRRQGESPCGCVQHKSGNGSRGGRRAHARRGDFIPRGQD